MPQAISISALIPETMLVALACLVLLLAPVSRAVRKGLPMLALVGIVLTRIVTFWKYQQADHTGAGLAFGSVSYFVRISTLVMGVLIILANWSQAREGEEGEFFSMLLFSLAGLMLVAPSDNLVMLFIALELVSIPNYITVAISRSSLRALEGGTKYFYLGAMAAAVLAYGFSFIYGVAGSIDLSAATAAMKDALAGQRGETARSLALIGMFLSLGGLFFKIAAVPLHFYIADVYQGAAHGIAGMLGFVPKLAGFVAVFKLAAISGVWDTAPDAVFVLLWIAAALSMTIGNVLALMQDNLKRMLAYSGIAHSGYMLVAVLAGPNAGSGGSMGNGMGAVLYYAVIYGIANLGAFLILGLLRCRGQACQSLREVAGLIRREPALALLLALAILTLMGLPPTPGFWGKLSLFGSAISAAQEAGGAKANWLIALVIIAVLNTAIAAAYYLRVIAALLLYESDEPAEADPAQEWSGMGAYMCGVLLLIFAFYPNALLMSGLAATNSARQTESPQIVQIDAGK